MSIKSEEIDRLARELAAETDESITEALTIALRERLERVRAYRNPDDGMARVDRVGCEYNPRPRRDQRSHDEIIGLWRIA